MLYRLVNRYVIVGDDDKTFYFYIIFLITEICVGTFKTFYTIYINNYGEKREYFSEV